MCSSSEASVSRKMSSSRFSTTIGASVNSLLLLLGGVYIVLYARDLVHARTDKGLPLRQVDTHASDHFVTEWLD